MAGIAGAYYEVTPRSCEMGRATVVAVSATTLTILTRGTSVEAAYLASYASPAVGDLVAFFRQDSTWLVPGRIAGVGSNEVDNFSFEDDGITGEVPSSWFLHQIAGATSAAAVSTGAAPAGLYELATIGGAAGQDVYVYSNPIPVTTGEQWAISGLASSTDATADAAIYALWFANDTNLYPTTTAADTLVAQVNNVGPLPVHSSVSGTVTVPGAGTEVMRVATRSISGASITMYWDALIARRVG